MTFTEEEFKQSLLRLINKNIEFMENKLLRRKMKLKSRLYNLLLWISRSHWKVRMYYGVEILCKATGES